MACRLHSPCGIGTEPSFATFEPCRNALRQDSRTYRKNSYLGSMRYTQLRSTLPLTRWSVSSTTLSVGASVQTGSAAAPSPPPRTTRQRQPPHPPLPPPPLR